MAASLSCLPVPGGRAPTPCPNQVSMGFRMKWPAANGGDRPRKRRTRIRAFYASLTLPSSEVQCAQRVALMGMLLRQWGHSLVVGSAGGASSSRFSLLMPLMSRNTAKATIRKLITALMNTP